MRKTSSNSIRFCSPDLGVLRAQINLRQWPVKKLALTSASQRKKPVTTSRWAWSGRPLRSLYFFAAASKHSIKI